MYNYIIIIITSTLLLLFLLLLLLLLLFTIYTASQLKLISIQDGPQSIIKAIEVFSTPNSKQAAIKMIFADTMVSDYYYDFT